MEQSPENRKLGSKRKNQVRSHSTDLGEPKGIYATHDGGLRQFFQKSALTNSTESPMNDTVRRVNDATGEKEIYKAMSTYLNKSGAADYNLPRMTGEKIMVSKNRTNPKWKLHDRTKLAWFPGRDVDFAGTYSPGCTAYSPHQDRPFRNQKYSVGNESRFTQPAHISKIQKQVAHQYETQNEGLITGNSQNYDFNRVSIGYGTKSDFTNSREMRQIPGAKYENHDKNSIQYISKKKNPKSQFGFFNKYDKWERTCYGGMEQHFYMRETKGPGAYLKTDFVHLSPTAKASEWSVPKTDRGLLTFKPPRKPGPGYYDNDVQAIKTRVKDQTFAMPKASRDVSFSKYGAGHAELVRKGLF